METFGMVTDIGRMFGQRKGNESVAYINLIGVDGKEYYVTEYDGEDVMYVYIIGGEKEWDYFNYDEFLELIENGEMVVNYNFKPTTINKILSNKKI